MQELRQKSHESLQYGNVGFPRGAVVLKVKLEGGDRGREGCRERGVKKDRANHHNLQVEAHQFVEVKVERESVRERWGYLTSTNSR